MKIKDSYFVKFANKTSAWLAVGKSVPEDATVVEVRPMLMPDFGKVLHNKETGETSSGHWLRDSDSADKWVELPEVAEEIEESENNSLESLK